MTKHTPGPWWPATQNDALYVVVGHRPAKSNDDPWHDAPRAAVARVYRDDDLPLIAAAPEMLEALRKAENFIANTEGELGMEMDSGRAVRAAIAKAEGAP